MEIRVFVDGKPVYVGRVVDASANWLLAEPSDTALQRSSFVELELSRLGAAYARLPAVVTGCTERRLAFEFECDESLVRRALCTSGGD